MMTEADYYALFEAYQRGELAVPARTDLERRLAADPSLAERYADFTSLTDTLHSYGQRLSARRKLRAIQAEVDAEQAVQLDAMEEGEVFQTGNPLMPQVHISRTEQQLRRFWQGHRATRMVAASVSERRSFT